MKVLFFTIGFFIYCSTCVLSQSSVKLQMLGDAKSSGTTLKVEVKNLSKMAITVLKDRRWDYKWNNCNSLGNYIIEVQKYDQGKFQSFQPSSDLDPFYVSPDYIVVKTMASIVDTLYIDGNHFSRLETKKKGFPSGSYRVRVSFNASEWGRSQENSSEWIAFKIE